MEPSSTNASDKRKAATVAAGPKKGAGKKVPAASGAPSMRGTLSKSGGGSKRRVGAVVPETSKGAAAAKSRKTGSVTILAGQTAAGRKTFGLAGPSPTTTALAATAVGRKRSGDEVGANEEEKIKYGASAQT